MDVRPFVVMVVYLSYGIALFQRVEDGSRVHRPCQLFLAT